MIQIADSPLQWGPQQTVALESVCNWLEAGFPQVFRLFGFAGTGKTTLAKAIAAQSGLDVLFAAYTGKAALMLRLKGCARATTLHRLLYIPIIDDKTGALLGFELNTKSPLEGAQLAILDECSMVDAEIGGDLLRSGVQVLVLGDPAQLPPINGPGMFDSLTPEVLLTEIHRQAADNPIIAMSMDVRAGKPLTLGKRGDSQVLRRVALTDDTLLREADQILVGRNTTRQQVNRAMRKLFGRMDPLPVEGDKLVCLANDHKLGLLNGSLWEVAAPRIERLPLNPPLWKRGPKIANPNMRLQIRSLDEERPLQFVEVHPAAFLGGEIPWIKGAPSQKFDYGYALTVHKAQGSQWNRVLVFDESAVFREHKSRWLYTAITRAAERVTVVQ